MNESKGPIIAKLEKNRIHPRDLGRGTETKGISQIKSFEASEIEEGQPASYAEKPLDPVEGKNVALDTLEMYQKLKSLGLPVVSFLKIVKRREGDQDNYYIAMEDLSEAGKNLVVEIWQPKKDPQTGKLHFVESLWKGAENFSEIRDQMVRALAVLHNNGIFEYHPVLSFVVVVEKSKVGSGQKHPLRFKIIDYSNFTHAESRNVKELQISVNGQQRYMQENLEPLQTFLASSAQERAAIENAYLKYRKQGVKTFRY